MRLQIHRWVSAMAAAVLLVEAGAAVRAGSLSSDLQIEAGQTFELGGSQDGGFAVTGRNTGSVAVLVLGKAEGAAAVAREVIAPGGAVGARFGPGEMALLRNTSRTQMARLKLKITGDTASLGMTYSANR